MNLEKIVRELAMHLCDTSAQLCATQPIYAVLETQIAGMSKEISFNTRLFTFACAYIGGGRIVSYCRDKYREYFQVTPSTQQIKQVGHDTIYLAAFNLVTSPFIYAICGSRNANELLMGGLIGACLGTLLGGIEGYSIDACRDLFGIKTTKRLPAYIAKQKPFVKKSIGAAFISTSIFLTTAYYALC